MILTLNGESFELPDMVTVSDLLSLRQVDARYAAVELNGQVVPRALHSKTGLKTGDVVEIVTLVGGG